MLNKWLLNSTLLNHAGDTESSNVRTVTSVVKQITGSANLSAQISTRDTISTVQGITANAGMAVAVSVTTSIGNVLSISGRTASGSRDVYSTTGSIVLYTDIATHSGGTSATRELLSTVSPIYTHADRLLATSRDIVSVSVPIVLTSTRTVLRSSSVISTLSPIYTLSDRQGCGSRESCTFILPISTGIAATVFAPKTEIRDVMSYIAKLQSVKKVCYPSIQLMLAVAERNPQVDIQERIPSITVEERILQLEVIN